MTMEKNQGSMKGERRLVVAGGGTGGHVWAGVAIADAWRDLHGEKAQILYVGARGQIEERLVPKSGYRLETLVLGSLKDVSLARKLKTFIQLPLSLLRSAWILLSERPEVVVGVGGYSSGPVVLMARLLGWLWGARVGILEQNAVPGFTNGILGRFAHRVLVAFPGVEASFPAGKGKVTGNPVRNSLVPMPSAEREPFTIFIFGGSLGAMGINTLVLDAIPFLADLLPRLRFIHQTGEKDYERVREGHARLNTGARVEKFIYDMQDCYRQASLIICRSGSSTLSEIAAVGRAAVFVPFPFHSDRQQERNARIFTDRGAGKLLLQNQAKGQDLAELIRQLYGQPAEIGRMEAEVRQFHRPDAARTILAELSVGSR